MPKYAKNKGIKCKCGKDARAKGMCARCYNREREYTRKNKHPGITKEALTSICFEIRHGLTISVACKKLNISRSELYRNMTPKQKETLRIYKAIWHNSYKAKSILDGQSA